MMAGDGAGVGGSGGERGGAWGGTKNKDTVMAGNVSKSNNSGTVPGQNGKLGRGDFVVYYTSLTPRYNVLRGRFTLLSVEGGCLQVAALRSA